MVVVLFFAVGIAVIVGFQWLMSRTVASVNRGVFRRNNAEGLAFLNQPISYDLTATAGVVDAVWGGVKAKEDPPAAVVADTYRVERTATHARWAHGNKMGTSFTAVLSLSSSGDRARAVLAFPEMTEAGGVIADVSAMRALRHDVEVALTPFLIHS